jgi:hypothetical protein
MNPLHTRALSNFDRELRDGTVFAALIKSHYGEPPALKNFRNSISNSEQQIVQNARCIVGAMAEIGISTHITPDDILMPSGRELLLFCV